MADVETTYESSAASAEIPIGADDLDSLDRGERRRQRVERLRDDQGEGAVLGLVESLADPDWRVRRSAATALAGEMDVDASTLLGDLLYSDDAGERNAAIKALIKRSSESMKVLVKELGSEVADVRNFAALALGQIGDPSALEHLIPMLSAEEDENVQHMVIEAVGRIGHESAAEPLLEILEQGTFASVAAAEALGSIASERAVIPMTRMLSDDPIGAGCAEALARIGDVRAIEPLVRSVEGATIMYGTCVVRAMADIIEPEEDYLEPVCTALREQLREEASPEFHAAVVACLGCEGPDRLAGMKVAVWLGDPDLTPNVCQAAQTPDLIGHAARFLAQDLAAMRGHLEAAARSTYPTVRSVLARALACGDYDRDIEMLLRLIDDENLSVRIEAITALATLGGSRHADVLVRLLGDEFDDVRCTAADALASVGGIAAAEELAACVECGNEAVRDAVARALSRMRWQEGSDRLWDIALTLARDPSPAVRRQVAPALGSMPGHEALSVLLTLALDDDHLLRVTAVRTLAARPESTARKALRQALEEGSTSISSAALRGLASHGADEEDLSRMRSLLHSSDTGIVVAALSALAKCGSSEEIPAVVQLVKHPTADVREAALRTLLSIGPSVACDVAALVLGGSESSWSVRLAATEALQKCDAPEAKTVLERALTDEEPIVRRQAVAAVPGAYGPGAIDRLVPMLDDETLASEAAESLRSMGEPAVDGIIAHASTLTERARRLLSVVLGRIGSSDALEYLLGEVASADIERRWTAALGLSVMTSPAHADRIERLIASETDPSVRAALTAALRAGTEDAGGDAQ